jgi:hypothetical protein
MSNERAIKRQVSVDGLGEGRDGAGNPGGTQEQRKAPAPVAKRDLAEELDP